MHHINRLPPAIQQEGTRTRLGAATFVVSRRYVGNRSVHELLEQRVQQLAQLPSSIDAGSGSAV